MDEHTYGVAPTPASSRIGKLRSTLRAIAETLDAHELRVAAQEALDEDDADGVSVVHDHTASPSPTDESKR